VLAGQAPPVSAHSPETSAVEKTNNPPDVAAASAAGTARPPA